MMLQKSAVSGSRMASRQATRPVPRILCQAQKRDEQEAPIVQRMALPLASFVAAAMLAGAAFPEQALAANSRSGGRVGGSSGFAARKGAPTSSRSITTQAAPSPSSTTTVIRQTNVVVAPSVSPFGFSPFGFGMPFGGFGFGFGSPVVVATPFPFFGPLLTFMFLLLAVNVVFSVVKGFMAKKEQKDDSWGDL